MVATQTEVHPALKANTFALTHFEVADYFVGHDRNRPGAEVGLHREIEVSTKAHIGHPQSQRDFVKVLLQAPADMAKCRRRKGSNRDLEQATHVGPSRVVLSEDLTPLLVFRDPFRRRADTLLPIPSRRISGPYLGDGADGRREVIMCACLMGNPKKLLSLTSTLPCSTWMARLRF